MATKLSSAAAPCGVSIIVLALLLTVQPSSSYAQQTVSESSDTEVSQAEQHFRLGVTLYKDGNFREALDEFNRALALDPDLEKATRYKDNTQEQLNVSATGEDPTARPTFESFDPESIGPLEESPQLSPEEHKIQKVRELVELAEQYLEFQFYDRAVEHFEQVLLIAPDNRRARKGLHEATLGAYRDETKEHQGTIREQTQRMRTEIEKMKLLPEGADSFGIRNPRIDVPKIEERVQQVEERSYIEEILENPVGVVFEDIHLQDILDFITDTYEVNIIVDNRVVDPPRDPQAQQGPGQGAPPGQRPGQRPGQLQNRGGGGGGFGGGIAGAIGSGQGPRGQGGQAQGEIMTDGMISYINLKNVTLREALKAILRPLNLDYSVQRSFIWISTAEKIRVESFETLETRFYELQNAGAETLFKIVLVNQGGLGSTLVNTPFGGGTGGGGGGTGGGGGLGGGGGGGLGGGGGGGTGGGGGLGGGGGGGLGGGGGGQGGGGQGGGGQRGGGQGGGGQGGGGQGGGGQGSSFSNISDLFQTINDIEVGEFPNPFSTGQGGGIQGAGGGGGGGTGAFGGGQQGQQGNEFFGGPGPGLGAQAGFVGEPTAIQIIRSLIPPVIEPLSRRLLSFMRYNILTNALVVHTSPANHKRLEALLKDLDATPKQVAIEAKFLTISVNDFDKVGFNWNFSVSDLNNRSRDIPGVTGTLTSVDLDGDGVPEVIPNNINPDGSNVIDNTISTVSLLTGLVSPMSRFADDNFSLTAGIISNADGDMLSVTFDFLDSLGESELLSSPRITTMNQKPAVIADVVSEFFLTNVSNSTLVISSGGIGGFSDTPVSTFQTQTFTEFITGITLSVTPQISGNQVRLWLNPQVTTIKDTKTFVVTSSVLGSDTSGIITLPTIATQAVWTNVIVNDGDTLVLGGTVSDITNKQEDRFPFLSDIPVFGFFFRGKLREVKQSSLLIFVTPNIIDSTGARYFESNL